MLTEARHVVLPDGIVSSGLPAAQATCETIGLSLDPWQVELARCILAKGVDGLYAADTVVISIPRQVGKTFLIGALVFADCIINPGTTTVWTAHRFKVARETFNELKGIALTAALAPHIDPEAIHTAAGNESITFRNGSRIVFAARERGAVRGFSKVRRLILDEAQILTESAMSDLAPTMNQAKNPQMILMGTPPKPSDPGETFTNLRSEALSGSSEGLVYVEFSADRDADLDDRAAWAVANPSLHTRTPEKAIVRLRKLLSNDDDFAREALGIWTGTGGLVWDVMPRTTWAGLIDPESSPLDPVAFGFDVNPERTAGCISVAAANDDGRIHVETIAHEQGVDWIVEVLARASMLHKHVAVVTDASGPAAALIPALTRRGVKVQALGGQDVARACASFYDSALAGRLAHRRDEQLTAALGAAHKATTAEGAYRWSRKEDLTVDISPLYAATFAVHGHASAAPPRKFWGAYG